MHFALERAVRAAEASSSAVSPISVPRQRLPFSVSGLIYTRNNQTAMITERRSMPCLRLSASTPYEEDQSRSNASAIERSESQASTDSSRRFVSSMKQLLPLRLQPSTPRPKVDLISWLDNTAPMTADLEDEAREGSSRSIGVPWMSSSQNVRLSYDLPPDRCREIPIYSGPGSPTLSRAYFSDEEACCHCSPKGSACDELCIVSDYEDAETTNSHSEASFIHHTDTFNAGKIGSSKKSPRSSALSRISKLAARCHGKCVPPDEAPWMKTGSDPWIGCRASEAASSTGMNEFEQEQCRFEGWLDSESSRSSCWSRNDEFLDAFATKLAPAKVHFVELNKALQTFPKVDTRPKSHWQRRPVTPYRFSRSQRTPTNNHSLTLEKKTIEVETTSNRVYQEGMPPFSVMSSPHLDLAMHSPSTSPTTTTSFGGYEDQFTEHRRDGTESDRFEASSSIVKSICDVVQGFPQHMLFLDTPCVIHVRRQNNSVQHAKSAKCLSIPSFSSSDYSLPLNHLRPSSRGRRATAKFLAPLLRATSKKTLLPRARVTLSHLISPLSRGSTNSRSLSLPSDPTPPDLSVIQRIFPDTQDLWREILYAHLVAYNYVCEIHAFSEYPIDKLPSKASRSLGIAWGSPKKSTTALHANTRLADLEIDLMSCITWITNCMTGRTNTPPSPEMNQHTRNEERILVKALAEIVKNCEKSCDKED